MGALIYTNSNIDAGEMRGALVTDLNGLYGSMSNLLLLASSLMVQMGGFYGNLNKQLYKIRNQTKDVYIELLKPSLSPNQVFAICQMKPSSDLATDLPSVSGFVLFSQSYPQGKLQAYVNLRGFPLSATKSLRAMHVHQYGVVNGSCPYSGPHYNPQNVNHPQHPGDFNNFEVLDGKIVKYLPNLRANLFGLDSILGRAVVLHEKADDLGLGSNQDSLKTGNSGRRLACGTILRSNGDLWKEMQPHM
ncbi:extracellular superoxide dismutase [Cu-Zn]-like [Leucoraja erinacea]|uniref:extracellular superoxide dismutase [Cu-Zn]-like n=1 Tax=Leucoraja erinaceus TaxID=7782 RepID=UPI002458FC2B|nr:extracellular superoxide dismutase [Cu-Zn]-like [Leucoraja erinacea]